MHKARDYPRHGPHHQKKWTTRDAVGGANKSQNKNAPAYSDVPIKLAIELTCLEKSNNFQFSPRMLFEWLLYAAQKSLLLCIHACSMGESREIIKGLRYCVYVRKIRIGPLPLFPEN